MFIGQKICLAPLLLCDGPSIFNWLNKLSVAYLNGPFRPTDQMSFDGWYSSIGRDQSRVMFAIRKCGDLRLLGYLQIINLNAINRCAELGILIGEASDQDKGFGREALGLGLMHCWKDLNLNRVSLYVYGDNPRAIHVYGQVGFTKEGQMKQAAFVNGQFVDVTVMGILRPTEYKLGG